jgi:2-hydroxy-3-oxopropionate reductase
MNIGFIGLGLMGRPLALHLEKAGHALHLWARRPESLEPFAKVNAQRHATAADVARRAEVVIVMVADAPDVEAVCLGEWGLAVGAAPGLIVVDMSTIAPDAARRIGLRLAEHGIEFLDAPVSGGEVGAINAALTIMVGGKPEIFEKVRPLFEKMGKSATLIGASGAGQVAKACNQILTGVGVMALAEAFNFARQSGVDPARVREALLGGFAYSKILENHGQRMLDRNFKPGFKAWMHQKDLRIVMEEAHRLGLMLPSAAATAQMFNAMVGSGLGESDSIAALQLLERMSTPDSPASDGGAE